MSHGVTDQAADSNGWFLHQILHAQDRNGASLFPEPSFVKSASRDQLVGDDSLAPGMFGDPVHRKFACHTGASTWLSAIAFHTQKQAYPSKDRALVEKRIDAAATFHGIGADVGRVKEAAAKYLTPNQEDLEDRDFGFIY